MKFAHISDLHLGKRLHQFSLMEDQKYILEQIVEKVIQEEVDAVLVAGDVYDKIYPSAEAISLFDSFLVELTRHEKKVFVISGNHDSPERIAFLGEITKKAGVYLTKVYDGEITPITLWDSYGPVHVYLLPFIKPVHVHHFYPQETIENYTDAMKVAVNHMAMNPEERNLLVAHQFVTGAIQSDSEEISVGGLDHVDAAAFSDFDYVALGHIHRPQNMGPNIRYCGTPLKYSFSEWQDQKSITIIEMKEKGTVIQKEIPLHPMRDLIKIRGTFQQLLDRDFPQVRNKEIEHQETNMMTPIDTNSYVHITLLDEQDVPNAFRRLSLVYPNLMQMEYDNTRTRQNQEVLVRKEIAKAQPEELFASFYENRNNQPLSRMQREYIMKKIEGIWKGEQQ